MNVLKRILFLSVMVLIVIGAVQGCSSSTETATTTTAATTSTTTTSTTTTSGATTTTTSGTTTTTAAGATTTSTTSTTTTTALGGSVSINGQLFSGSVGGASIFDVSAYAFASDYKVVIQNTESGSLEYADTDTSGSFSFTVPVDETYTVNVIGSDSKIKGPIVAQNLGSNEAAMGFTTAASVELGNILINTLSGLIAPTAEVSSSLVSTSEIARTDGSGVPVGVGNAGKGNDAIYGGTLASGFDSDKDGLPDFVDADNDGDGAIDELDANSGVENEMVVSNDRIDSVDVFTDLAIGYDYTMSFDPALYQELSFQVLPDTSFVNNITSIEITSIPTEYAQAELVDSLSCEATGLTYTDGTLWADIGYRLCKVGDEFAEEGGVAPWYVRVRPMFHAQAGDVFVFRVTYDDGTYEELSKMVNFSFSSIPSPESYRMGDGGLQDPPDVNGPANPLDISGSGTNEITINYSRPTDEDGNIMTGFGYGYNVRLYGSYNVDEYTNLLTTESGMLTEMDDGSGGNISLNYFLPTEYGETSVEAYWVTLTCNTLSGADAGCSLLMYFRQ